MKQDEDDIIIIYTNGTTVEVPASVIYNPWPEPAKVSTDEKKD